MIETLRIKDLGVIADAEVELHAGLNVVTGETGAGKTMVVTGLGLLLGQRADSSRVRAGATRAQVEGIVSFTSPDICDLIKHAGGTLDPADGLAESSVRSSAGSAAESSVDAVSAVLIRSVSAEGRSRAHVGGVAAPISVLTDVGSRLVAVHGQADQRLLRSQTFQREMVDRFGGADLLKVRQQVGEQFGEWQTRIDDLRTRLQQRQARAAEAAALSSGLERIDLVAPQPGEDAELSLEADRRSHAEALRAAADLAHVALTGESTAAVGDSDASALQQLAVARQTVESQLEHDPALAELGQRLREVVVLAVDVAGDLASYAASVEVDPARLQHVEERRAQLQSLQRAYGPTVDDVLAWAAAARQRLADLDDSDERITELQTAVDEAAHRLVELCTTLSQRRAAAAQLLANAVTAELHQLAMPHAKLSIQLSTRPDLDGLSLTDHDDPVAVGRHGVDEVEFLLHAMTKAPGLPLQRAASGGELSRVMLAIEVVLADADPVGTFVFDEIDAGIGGAAAIEVGRRLAALGQHRQVVVVTHLPQVAAFADRHFVVDKTSNGKVTSSDVVVLDDDARQVELARMLAGLADSDLGRAHASELLDLAARDRVTSS